VMKNVTGYDLSKLLAGSWGTLAVLDEVSVKVLPAPDQTRTLLLLGLADNAAVKVMCAALGSPHDVSGAAHVGNRTALRIEGVAPSVDARLKGLRELLRASGAKLEELGTLESRAFWREVRDVAPLKATGDAVVWKISCPPTEGPAVVARIKAKCPAVEAFYDWSGGLIWLALPASADADHEIVRGAVGPTGGHATLIRAPEAVRAAVPVFQPQPVPLAALASRVKESFDPKRLLNPGRMG
jgi:glycolate oxidase FAD binding subunit